MALLLCALALPGACDPATRNDDSEAWPVASDHNAFREGIPPRPGFLFAGAFPTARDSAGRQAILSPPGDRIIVIDTTGAVTTLGEGRLSRAVGVTNAPGGGWMVSERDGRLLGLGAAKTPAIVRPPFERTAVATLADGYIAVRSPVGAPVRPVANSALLARLDREGRIVGVLDTIAPPRDDAAWLAAAGHVAAGADAAYLAFFVRAELRAYALDGSRRWTVTDSASRGGVLTIGLVRRAPLLWRLSRDSASSHYLDAYDERTGTRLRTIALGARLGDRLLSLDSHGTVWSAPLDTLEVLAGATARREAPPLVLPTLDGDTIRLAALRGRVVLLNVWASWCAPCREEFPVMRDLHRELAPRGLALVAVNEDRDERAARAFLERIPATFPVAFGRGRLRSRLRYPGLPFTLVIDRRGRIAERIFGFAERDQAARLRGTIERLLAEP